MVRNAGWLLLLCATLVVPMACTGGGDDASFDQNPQPSAPSSFPSFLTAMNVSGNDVLFFAADESVQGNELWRSDGTAAGTFLVKDINAGPGDSSPSALAVMNNVLFFAANDGGSGTELWRSDGTAAGTVLVKDIVVGGGSSRPASLTTVGSTLFFVADDGVSGRELWKTDGTPSGTLFVKNINPGPADSAPSVLIGVGGTLFFVADDGVSGRELWVSNGTQPGTVRVKDINLSSGDSFPSSLTVMGGVLFFAAYDGGTTGRELWRSDGTEAGTLLVKDINTNPNVNSGYSFPSFLTDVGGTLFFSSNDGVHGVGLWKSDGTDPGSNWIKAFNPLGTDPGPLYFAAMNGRLFLEATDGLNGVELWGSDGTTAGTVQVKDINPEPAGDSGPSFLLPVAGTLFFAAFDGTGNAGGGGHGVELWKSDGTAAGTVLVKDIWPGITTSNPFGLTAMNGSVYFSADDGVHGVELWKSDGTDTGSACDPGTGVGTCLVLDIKP